MLCAVMLFTAAAQSFMDTGLIAAAEESSELPDDYPEGSEIDPKENMEEYVVYRWSPVTSGTMPGENDSDWHLAMLFRVWDNKIEGPYLNGKVPERLYLGSKPMYIPEGYNRDSILTYQSGSPAWDNVDKNDVAESTTHYLRNKYVYGYNDDTVDPNLDLFYTADDRDCLSIKKVSTSTYRRDSSGLGSIEYEIKFKSSNDKEYYLWGNVDSDNDANFWALTKDQSKDLEKTMKDNNYDESYKTTNRFCFMNLGKLKNGRETYNIVGEIKGHDPWLWMSSSGKEDEQWWYFRDKKTSDSRFVWFNGDELRYSAFRSSYELSNHMILSITKSTYTDESKEKASQQGVFLPRGKKITVNDGCILSISGNFINNGTIEINKGGTLIIRDGGTVYPFLPGTKPSQNGCGTIKCLGGDIVIMKGGALYGGLADENGSIADFNLDKNATLINQGLLVYGNMRLGPDSRVELYEGSKTYGGYYQMKFSYKKVEEVAMDYVGKNAIKAYSSLGWSEIARVKTGSTKSEYTGATVDECTVYFEKRTRIKPDYMLCESNECLLEGKPQNAKNLYNAYTSSEDLDIAKEAGTLSNYGMRATSDSITIKVAKGAAFNDDFAKKNNAITSHMSELKL